jgi:hypothetical protein
MMTHEAHEGRSAAGRTGLHRLLPVAGITAAVVALLVHLGGGAMLVHLGPGADLTNLGGGALVLVIMAVVTVKLLVVFGARHWLRRR